MAKTQRKNKQANSESRLGRSSDIGTPERRAQLMADNMLSIGITQANQRIVRCVPQIPLDFYARRKLIGEIEYSCATRLYRDFVLAGITPHMVVDLTSIRTGVRDHSDRQLDARQRCRDALAAINNDLAFLFVLNVCCYGYWLQDVKLNAERVGKNRRMQILRTGLDDLIEHYDGRAYKIS